MTKIYSQFESSKQPPVTSSNMVKKNIKWTDLCILRPEVLF